MDWILAAYAFTLGAVVGSFLNVVIHRYPAGESIVSPPSHCPRCSTRIRPWDNIPVVSFLLLRGRCRSCREPISVRYPLIELSNALFYLAVYYRTGFSIVSLLLAITVSLTLVLIYIDLDIQILPDVVDIPGIVIGVVIGSLKLTTSPNLLTLSSSIVDSLAGAALGAGIILLIALSYKLVRNVDGMGMGDVKMMAMIGAVSGWRPVLPVLLIASCVGAVAGLIVAARGRQGLQVALPFGVFLGLAFLVMLFFGSQLTRWYETALLI